MKVFDFVTDTSTLCVFDLVAHRHRLSDDADWWSLSSEAIAEINRGNAVIVDLGMDGKFSVAVHEAADFEPSVVCNINCPSGRIFVGAGEEITSDGLEPECVRGGAFLTVMPGCYRVAIAKSSPMGVLVCLSKSSGASNAVIANMSAEDNMLMNAGILQAVGVPDSKVELLLQNSAGFAGSIPCP